MRLFFKNYVKDKVAKNVLNLTNFILKAVWVITSGPAVYNQIGFIFLND